MPYSLNPEFDAKLKSAFDEVAYPKEEQETLLELMERTALTFSDKVCLRIAKDLLEEGLSPKKIKRITGCDVEIFTATLH